MEELRSDETAKTTNVEMCETRRDGYRWDLSLLRNMQLSQQKSTRKPAYQIPLLDFQ